MFYKIHDIFCSHVCYNIKNPFYRLEVSWQLSFLSYSPSKFSKSVFEHTYTQLITVGPQKGNFRYLNLIKGDKCKSNKRGLHFYCSSPKNCAKKVYLNPSFTKQTNTFCKYYHWNHQKLISWNLYFICVWRKFYDTVF